MNKKGFTLIELLSVVTLIVLLSLIVFPNITSNINKKKIELSEANNKLLAAASNTYIEKNPGKYISTYEADGSIYCIPIQEIINDGVLITPFKDINGNEIDYTNVVKATYQSTYNSFDYELVSKSECTEFVNYISRPQLSEGMIPVIYDDGTWKKADINSKWYNYSTKNWANAVLVNEISNGNSNSKSRKEYIEASPGTVINEDDILAYFVWIPRFRYKLFNPSTPNTIDIIFESVGTSKSKGTTQDEWLTHPAFTYNNQELSGIWMGKYETSNQDNNPIIKSNQTSWTNMIFVEANELATQMTNQNNIYGLKNVNTHMTRNSEWGAAAYLTNSSYGNYQNDSTTGNNTGIYNLSGNKEFVLLDNDNENSLGYALNETKNWTTNNSYITEKEIYLTRGNNSIFNYNKSKIMDSNTTYRISLISTESRDDAKIRFLLMADDISYDNTATGFKDSNGNDVVNVQTALDELYKLLD